MIILMRLPAYIFNMIENIKWSLHFYLYCFNTLKQSLKVIKEWGHGKEAGVNYEEAWVLSLER
jgi:hypothetical protein